MPVGEPAAARSRARLGPDGLAALARDCPGWTLAADGRRISRRFGFDGFEPAFAFVGEVVAIARAEDHHPDIAFGWGYAELALTTHDSGGLTGRDAAVAVAAAIDRIGGA